MYIGLHVKYLLVLSYFNETSIFWTYFRKIVKCQLSNKSVQWHQVVPRGTMYGRTDEYKHEEANSRFFAILRTRLKCNKRTLPRLSQQSLWTWPSSVSYSRKYSQTFEAIYCLQLWRFQKHAFIPTLELHACRNRRYLQETTCEAGNFGSSILLSINKLITVSTPHFDLKTNDHGSRPTNRAIFSLPLTEQDLVCGSV